MRSEKVVRLTFKAGSSKQGKACLAPDVSNWVVPRVLFVPSAAAEGTLTAYSSNMTIHCSCLHAVQMVRRARLCVPVNELL